MRLRNSLAIPIIILFTLVALSTLVIGYYINLRSLQNSLDAKEIEKATTTRSIINSIIKEEIRKLSALSRLLKENHEELVNVLVHHAVTGNLGPLKKLMDRLYPALAIDIFTMIDSKGALIYSANLYMEEKKEYKDIWGIDEALDGQDVLTVGKCPHGWSIRSFVPLYSANKFYGIIILGFHIDDNFTQKLASVTNTQVSFSTVRSVLATSLPPDQRSLVDWEAIKQSLWERIPLFVQDHTHYKILMYVPLMVVDETFCLVIQTDTKSMHELLKKNKTNLLKISIVILLSIIVIGSTLTIYLIRPLKKLQNQAQDMVKEFSGKETEVLASGNEIQTLVLAFNSMLETINNHIAGRKEAEEGLYTEKQRLKTLSENAPFGMAMIDKDGTFKYLNPKFSELFGYDLTDVPDGKTWFRKAYPNPTYRHDVISAWINDLKSLEPGEKVHRTFTVNCKDGTEKVVHFIPVLLETGEILMTCEDITERNRGEEALRESEERFRDLYDNAPVGYHEYDLEGRITNVNQTDLVMLGYSREEMIGQPIWKLNVNEETVREQVMAKLAGTLPPGKELERIYRRKDGTTFPVLVEDRLLLDEKGRIKGIRCTIQDITGIKQAEEALQRSEGESKKLAKENAILAEIGQIINSTLNIDEVYERFAEKVRELIPFDRIAINNIDSRDNTITISYLTGLDVPDRLKGTAIPLVGTLAGEVVRTRTNMLIQTEDLKKVTDRFPWFLSAFQAGIRSLMAIPLISKDEVIGVLHFQSTKPNAYGEKDLRLAEKVGNQIAGTIANAQLFTDRKQTEEALRESEKRFKELFDAAPIGYFEMDTNACITRINRTELEMLGYTAQEIIGRPIWDFLEEKEIARQKLTAKLAEALPPAKGIERTCIRKDGGRIPVLIEERILKDSEGGIIGMRSTMQNHMEFRRAEEALQRSEERAKRIAQENATMAEIGRIISSTLNIEEVYERFAEEVRKIIPFDRIGIQTINPKDNTTTINYISGIDVESRRVWDTVPIFGTATGECIRTRSSILFQAESIDEVANRFPGLLPTFKAGLRSTMLVPLISKDEVFGVLSLRATKPNVYTEGDLRLAERVGNQIAGAIANAQLFAERVQAEQKAKSLEEQLHQSQKMEAIGRLAGGIAHDFNNLLTVIKGYSDFSLLELKEDNPLKENIKEIQKASQRAADLTRQLLAFSRRQVFDMKALNLNSILRDIDKMLRRVIGEDIELGTLLAEDLGKTKADPGQIEQVIINLAVNARDAMSKGGKLTIETANVELDEAYARSHIAVTPGRYVMLSVSDTGVGMSPDVRERVFEPFFTTKEKDKGTGLGLSMVYGIVKQSEGNIWVYSEPGRGTTFKIYLPHVDEPLEEMRDKVVVEKLTHGSETILVVEDEEAVRKLAVRILERQGYKVIEAGDGGEALCLCEQRKEPVHLILTDVVMPEMSGRQLVDQFRQVWQDFKVLYMSGYTDNTIVSHGVLEKGVNYIQKPFTPDALARKVYEVLHT